MMRRVVRACVSLFAVAAIAAAALAVAAPAPPIGRGGPPGQENCTRPCAQWKVVNKMRCKFVGCSVDGVCRYLC